ncbi:MAG: methyltransferase domain-containing protein [Phycisphaerales bacterium]
MIRGLYRTARRLRDEFLYRGDAVECPCCGGTFRAFMPYGNKVVRPNARCPRCFSAERQRMVLCYLRERTNIFTDALSVLHFAPEAGIERHLRTNAKLGYTTADLDGSRADEAMDITDIPRPDGTFDVVLCSHVLEHVPDDRKAMREIFRVLKPGGFAILLVPLYEDLAETYENRAITTPAGRLEHFDQVDHVRKYGMDYFDRLREAGFVVNRVDYGREVGEVAARRFGFNPREQVERAEKPA